MGWLFKFQHPQIDNKNKKNTGNNAETGVNDNTSDKRLVTKYS